MASDQEGSKAFAPVIAALSTIQSNSPRPEKVYAHEYLEKFQKSVCNVFPRWQLSGS